MPRYLHLRLAGSLMAMGTVAIDDRRPTGRFPSLSAVAGLLGNAMGYKRSEPGLLQELQDGLTIASRVDREGQQITDYQTVRLPGEKDPIQLYKDYWADSEVSLLLAGERIDEWAEAVQRPARPLFLGRASCPPSERLFQGFVDAGSFLQAVKQAPFSDISLQNHTRFFKAGETKDVAIKVQLPGEEDIAGTSGFLGSSGWVSDRKEWRHGLHMGQREVLQGIIKMPFTKPTPVSTWQRWKEQA